MTDVVRVCVVCAGNICRSPMAEAVLRAKLDHAGLSDRVVVDSAGTGNWHAGQPAHVRSTAALARRGYDLEHSARQFVPAWFGERDLVLALDAANLSDLARLAPRDLPAGRLRMLVADRDGDRSQSSGGTDVPDPYGLDDVAYDHALYLIERACDVLVAELVAELPPGVAAPVGTSARD